MLKGPRMLFFGTDGREEYMRLRDRDSRKQLSMHQKLIALSGEHLPGAHMALGLVWRST